MVRKLRRTLLFVLLAVFAIVLALALLIVVVVLRLFIWTIDIPNKIGKRLHLAHLFRSALYTIVDPTEIEYYRDEVMELLHSKTEYREGIERWGLEREIDLHREKAIGDLRRGEQIIAIFGGFTALFAGYVFGINLGALALSIAILFFTLAAGFRLLVVDVLAYSSINHRSASLSELAKMKTWNEGPLRGKSGVGIVIVAIITSRGSLGHEWGFRIMDYASDLYFDYNDEKWKGQEASQIEPNE